MMFVSTLICFLSELLSRFCSIYGLGYGATFVLLQRLVAELFWESRLRAGFLGLSR